MEEFHLWAFEIPITCHGVNLHLKDYRVWQLFLEPELFWFKSIDLMQTWVYVILTTCSWMQVTGTWLQPNTSATGQTTISKLTTTTQHNSQCSQTWSWTCTSTNIPPTNIFAQCFSCQNPNMRGRWWESGAMYIGWILCQCGKHIYI